MVKPMKMIQICHNVQDGGVAVVISKFCDYKQRASRFPIRRIKNWTVFLANEFRHQLLIKGIHKKYIIFDRQPFQLVVKAGMSFFPAKFAMSEADCGRAIIHLCQNLRLFCSYAIYRSAALYHCLKAVDESLIFVFCEHVVIFWNENRVALKLLVLVEANFFRQNSAIMTFVGHSFPIRCRMYFTLKIILIFLKKYFGRMAKFSAEIAIAGDGEVVQKARLIGNFENVI